MTDEDRIFSVDEYLANMEQKAGKIVKISGPLGGWSEAQCYVGTYGGRNVVFDSGDLPEPDRLRLIESMGTDSKPREHGVVTINTAGNRAVAIEFDK